LSSTTTTASQSRASRYVRQSLFLLLAPMLWPPSAHARHPCALLPIMPDRPRSFALCAARPRRGRQRMWAVPTLCGACGQSGRRWT
jgi:hypothetical protein